MAKSFDTFYDKLPQASKNRIEARVQEAMEEMPLAELRQARSYTQQQLAQSLDINQASVSKMENQADMYLSTLRKYIEAMGGQLEIKACFPDGCYQIVNFKTLGA